MAADEHRLHAGEMLSLAVEAGLEVFCAEGRVALQVLGASAPRVLRAGEGWRAGEDVRVTLQALGRCRLRVVVAPRAAPARPWWTPPADWRRARSPAAAPALIGGRRVART